MNKDVTHTLDNIKRTAPSEPLKILVIENDPDLRCILEELFTEAGYGFRIYEDTENILPLIDDFKPDLVLLDYMLSMVNGGELCGQVKRNEATNKIPVILYSAFPKVFLSLGDYGCDLFMPKPFDLDDLLFQIEKLTGRLASGRSQKGMIEEVH